MLNDILTEQELSQGAQDPRLKPQETRGSLSSVVRGLGAGGGKGLTLAGATISRPIFGEEVTDRVVNSLDATYREAFGATNLSTAGEFTYSTSTMLGGVIGSNLITAGLGGTYGTAATFGVVSASTEKAELKAKGLSTSEAWKGGAIKGSFDAATVALPTGGIVRNKIADVVLSVGGATGAGALGQYAEGAYVESVATTDKAKQYGKSLKDGAFEAQSLAADSSFGLLLWGLNAYGRGRVGAVAKEIEDSGKPVVSTDAEAQLVGDVTDAAHIDVNMEMIEKSNPLQSTSPKDTNTHFDLLDKAMTAVKSDQPFTNTVKASGNPKPVIALPANALRIRERASNEFGFTEDQMPYLLASVDLESNFNHKAFNTGSKAQGLFQVIPSTWEYRKGGDINNVDEQIRVGLDNMRKDISQTEKLIGRKLQGSEIYLPQFLGAGGASKVLKANPDADFFTVAKSIYSKSKNPEAVARKMMKDNGIKDGSTVAQVKNKFLEKIESRAAKYGGNIDYDASFARGSLSGSESNFPDYEIAGVQIPEYKSALELNANVMPDFVTPKTDLFELQLRSDEFEAMQQLPTQSDLDMVRSITGYQPVDSSIQTVPYVPQVVSFDGLEVGSRSISELDNVATREIKDNIDSDPLLKSTEQQAIEMNQAQPDLSDWSATRSDNYVKRQMVNNDVTTQELYNKQTGATFSREVGKDGKVSPVKISKGGKEITPPKGDTTQQTELQAAATKAIEAEFAKAEESAPVKSFESTPDGREASKILDSNPDMEVTFTPTDIDGMELEPVTMKASELKDFIKNQYEEVATDVEAVRVAASCAIKFGV